MRRNRQIAAAAIVAAMVVGAATAAEPDYLGADEVKNLIVGKTIEVQAASGETFRVYFAPDGRRLALQAGAEYALPWRILPDGRQCVTTGTGEECARIASNGDGTYTRFVDGIAVYRWLAFLPGKALDVVTQAPGIYTRQAGPDRYQVLLTGPALTEELAHQRAADVAVSLCKALVPVPGAFKFESREAVAGGDAAGARTFQYTQEISCVPGVKQAPVERKPLLRSAEESRAIQEAIRARTEAYFRLLATNQLDAAFAQVDAKSLGQDAGKWQREKQSFQELAGEPVRLSISKVTVYDNPAEAPEPGLYVAADYSNEFRNVPFHCGYLMWFRPVGGEFHVTREETGHITAEQLKTIPAAQLPEIKRRLRCVTP